MSMTVPFWTREGTVDLANLQPENLTPEIIADTLAKVNRFGGRTAEPWSVSSHSVLVEHLCPPDLRPWALLHDADVAFLGDLTWPAVEMLCLCGTRPAVENAISNAKGRIDRMIARAWGVAVRSMSLELRRADFIALRAEAYVFLGTAPELTASADRDDFDRALSLIPGLNLHWSASRALWLSRVDHYASLGLLSPPRLPHSSSVVLGA